ncbi:hypothetical protein OFN62_33975, partial [Escherichia coli]|nr:hypothetical protein [Escherichia coli]
PYFGHSCTTPRRFFLQPLAHGLYGRDLINNGLDNWRLVNGFLGTCNANDGVGSDWNFHR